VPDENRPPLADELARLLGAVHEWTRENLPAAPEGATTCDWCPLCQFVAVLRGERPDVTERVSEAGTAMAAAVRALLDAATSGRPATEDPTGSRVERIDLDDPPTDTEP
jgi:hypothetical protein